MPIKKGNAKLYVADTARMCRLLVDTMDLAGIRLSPVINYKNQVRSDDGQSLFETVISLKIKYKIYLQALLPTGSDNHFLPPGRRPKITIFGNFRNNYVIFKESALWADSFYKSKCPYVCLSVTLSHSV